MRRAAVVALAALALCLTLPGASAGRLAEIGVLPAATPPTPPSCPTTPCLAVSRTTGFQVKVGAAHNFLAVPRAGRIVAWTVTLGKPNATQIKFFNENEGGVAQAGIAVLRPVPKPNLTYKLAGLSPPVALQTYFGKTVQFPLETTLAVKKGDVVALSVPTWAPALALGFGRGEAAWRASRPRSSCGSTSALSTQTQIGSPVQYFCLYQTARLTYSATLISTP